MKTNKKTDGQQNARIRQPQFARVARARVQGEVISYRHDQDMAPISPTNNQQVLYTDAVAYLMAVAG